MIVMARLHALRNDQNLARFVIDGESYGRHLGTGSYGSVEEVSLKLIQSASQLNDYYQCSLILIWPFSVDNNQRFGVCWKEDS